MELPQLALTGVFLQQLGSTYWNNFINLFKLIAMPLVLSSLITGIASLSDLKKLSRIGGKTIGIYLGTTAVAVTIGLASVNLIKPGDKVPYSIKNKLQLTYEEDAIRKAKTVEDVKSRGPLQPFIDMIPSNFSIQPQVIKICSKSFL